ncbi:MAG: ATP synthase F1 subunit epsilon [Crocinitomicaceae bacterium]|nr:ATP synthase F1 subunit epsilon [Crocinitomicaceae bacterium]|tara:strand:+ start:14761 stop:14994 length:234 start_codon:yes stop_codon:yes gene_type:complete
MTVEILTPDVVLYEGDAKYVGLPGSDGSLGILNNHSALVTTLIEGEVVVQNDNDKQVFAVKGGTVEVLNNHVTVLAQ